MPLYMDCHDVPGIKIQEAEKAHLKDLAVQEKYDVKYLAYWVNEDSGKVFCLMKAPNKEAKDTLIQAFFLLIDLCNKCCIFWNK